MSIGRHTGSFLTSEMVTSTRHLRGSGEMTCSLICSGCQTWAHPRTTAPK